MVRKSTAGMRALSVVEAPTTAKTRVGPEGT